MAPSENTDNTSRSGFWIYFWLGVVGILALGFTWALGNGFRYLTFGLSAWFFFMAYYNRPAAFRNFNGPLESVADDLRRIFSPKKNTYTQHKGIPRQQKPTVVLIAFFFIFFVFSVIIVAVVVLSGETDNSETSMLDSAGAYSGKGDYDSARLYYHKVLAANPNNDPARIGLGNSFMYENKYDSALFYFDLLLTEDPENTEALYNHALVKYNQKDYSKSLREAITVTELDPQYRDGFLLAGDNYYIQQSLDSAIFWYEQGYALGARSAILSHIMAYIYDVQGKIDQAIPFYQEAVYYDSTRVDAYRRLGELVPEESPKYRELERRFSQEQ